MIGRTLAHYEIVALLGEGGMGEVYRAHDTKLARDVALKVLPRELSGDPERAAPFSREARSLASLQHPNVASIYGFEEAHGLRFLTMGFVDGEDLSIRMARDPIPTDESLDGQDPMNSPTISRPQHFDDRLRTPRTGGRNHRWLGPGVRRERGWRTVPVLSGCRVG